MTVVADQVGGWNVTEIDLNGRGINVLFPENLFNSLPHLKLLCVFRCVFSHHQMCQYSMRLLYLLGTRTHRARDLNSNNFTGCGWSDMTRFPKLDTFRLKGWKQGDLSLCPLPQFWTVPTLKIFNVENGNMIGALQLQRFTWSDRVL